MFPCSFFLLQKTIGRQCWRQWLTKWTFGRISRVSLCSLWVMEGGSRSGYLERWGCHSVRVLCWRREPGLWTSFFWGHFYRDKFPQSGWCWEVQLKSSFCMISFVNYWDVYQRESNPSTWISTFSSGSSDFKDVLGLHICTFPQGLREGRQDHLFAFT